MMLKVEFDLEGLSAEELAEAQRALHRDAEWVPAHMRGGHHEQLAALFTALELSVREEAAIRRALAERHEIAEALGIDEQTGEWMAGA